MKIQPGWWVGNKKREVWEARKHGGLVVSGARGAICIGVRGPRVCELGPRGCQAAGDTFLRRPLGAIPRALPNWQWVVPTRHIYRVPF